MSDEDTIKDLIANSRADLVRAKNALEDTPRPQSVCASHDAMFAIQRATANALDTVLVVLGGRHSETAGGVKGVFLANLRLLVVCATILGSVACLTGNFDKLMEGVLKLRVSHMTALP